MNLSSSHRQASSCEAARHRARLALQEDLAISERTLLERHMAECPSCAEYSPEIRALREALKGVRPQVAPRDLHIRLRVQASREASRRRQVVASAGWWNGWISDLRVTVNNMMRPLAIPTAGGFVSALMLFGMLAPGLAVRSMPGTGIADVPTVLYTEPSVKRHLPLDLEGQDIVVELTVDYEGRMLDYSIPSINRMSPELRRSLESALLTMEFTPATTFGQRTSGKVRIWFQFHNSSIDVRG